MNFSRRRHHTSGSNPGRLIPSTPENDAVSTSDDNGSMKHDPLTRRSQGTSNVPHLPPSSFSMYSQSLNDPSIYLQDNDINQEEPSDDHPRLERLEDIEDDGPYLDQQCVPGSEPFNVDNPYNQNYDEENSGQDNTLKGPTPLPMIPLFVLTIVIFSEPLTSTILFPFVDFHITENEDEIGFFCGLIGNVGVAKSMLGEIADHTNQSQAFSLFGFAWGIGMIVGPVLGGYLANPAKNFPEIFGDWEFFIEYPYFLPCFVAAMGSVVGFIVGYFFLEEPKKRKFDSPETLNPNSYQIGNRFPGSRYGSGEALTGGHDHTQPLKATVITSRSTSPINIDNEHQPLIAPQSQQIKFSNRNAGQSAQYGSTITLTHDEMENPASSQYPSNCNPSSARSTISRRSVSTRPSIVHPSAVSASREPPLDENNINRWEGVGRNSFYSSQPISSSCLSFQAPQGIATIPADATSLSLYGYIQDPYLDSCGPGGEESGRRSQSRMSFAPSQVYMLPPDPNNKDPNQPVQLIVVQPEGGLSPLSITTIVAYAMLALHSIVFEEVYTLYVVTPLKSHGLGWNAIQLSTSLASMGIVQLSMQFIVYPRLERIFSAVRLFQFGQLLYMSIYILFPLIRTFAVDESDEETGGQIPRVRYIVLFGLVFKYFGSVLSYTSVMVMINNSSPPHLLGTVNGIGQTSASFMRAFGPALGGVLWAWSLSNKLNFPFNYFFVFFLMATIAILGFIHSLSIPREIGGKRT
ncbi:hypothetical protein BGZ46_005200 [Entomortierella lignicola]|nr:hypothetical protein BGZ46_005200 [Entomortierella lignicola]